MIRSFFVAIALCLAIPAAAWWPFAAPDGTPNTDARLDAIERAMSDPSILGSMPFRVSGSGQTRTLGEWLNLVDQVVTGQVVLPGSGGTAPIIYAPATGAATVASSLTVYGWATPGQSVRILRDGILQTTVTAGTFGEFSGLATLSSAPPAGYQYTDNFATDTSANYDVHGAVTISGGTMNQDGAVAGAGQAKSAIHTGGTTFADGVVTAAITNSNWVARATSLYIRSSGGDGNPMGTATAFLQAQVNASAFRIELYEGPSFTLLGTYPIAAPVNGNTYTLRIAASGSAISVYWNGTLLGTGTTTNVLAAGRAGVGSANWTSTYAAVAFDDFTINATGTGTGTGTNVLTAVAVDTQGNAVATSAPVSVVIQAPAATQVAVTGDSISASAGFGGVTSWPEALLPSLPSGSSINNQSVSGQTTAQQLVLFEANIRNAGQAWWAALIGTNDIRTTPQVPRETVLANILLMASEAEAAGKRVILSTILPNKNETYDDTEYPPGSGTIIDTWNASKQADKEWINAQIRSACASNGYYLLDAYAWFGSVADRAVLSTTYANADLIHLNQTGENHFATLVKAIIAP